MFISQFFWHGADNNNTKKELFEIKNRELKEKYAYNKLVITNDDCLYNVKLKLCHAVNK